MPEILRKQIGTFSRAVADRRRFFLGADERFARRTEQLGTAGLPNRYSRMSKLLDDKVDYSSN